jgi:hypothetical protein
MDHLKNHSIPVISVSIPVIPAASLLTPPVLQVGSSWRAETLVEAFVLQQPR